MKTKKSQKKNSLQRLVFRQLFSAAIPHKGNLYQPHLIRRHALILVAVLLIGAQGLYLHLGRGSVLGENVDVSVSALITETNKQRQERNLSGLRLNQQLSQAAYLKVTNMFEMQYWDHNAPDGTKPWRWLHDAGYQYSKAGENLAKNFYTAEAAVNAWMNSAEHKDNMLDKEFSEVGFAVASGELDGKPTTIVVALYGRPATLGAVSEIEAIPGTKQQSLDPLTRLGVGIQSMTPAAVGSVAVLAVLMAIAYGAHLYRERMPAPHRRVKHRYHHGAIKMGLMTIAVIGIFFFYGGGQL